MDVNAIVSGRNYDILTPITSQMLTMPMYCSPTSFIVLHMGQEYVVVLPSDS